MFSEDSHSALPGTGGHPIWEARQLNHWLQGKSLHLEMPDLCCPDYSCCQPDLLAPLEERELYVQAHNAGDVKTLTRLDCMFLGRLIVRQTGDKI